METVSANMFIRRLIDSVNAKKTPLVVGLDPNLHYIPDFLLREFDLLKNSSLKINHSKSFCSPSSNNNISKNNISGGIFKSNHSIIDRNVRELIAGCLEKYVKAVIDIVKEAVAVVKFQTACYEQFGGLGMVALENLIHYARKQGLIVIVDGKRADVPHTAAIYGAAYLKKYAPFESDALTVQPYMGMDCLQEFFNLAALHDKGIFVCIKTSNHGAKDFQDLVTGHSQDSVIGHSQDSVIGHSQDSVMGHSQDSVMGHSQDSVIGHSQDSVTGYSQNSMTEHSNRQLRLYEHIAKTLNNEVSTANPSTTYKGYQAVGIVAGATHPKEASALRNHFKSACFLVPGLGAQGGDINTLQSFLGHSVGDYFSGALFNVSRGILMPTLASIEANTKASIEANTKASIEASTEANTEASIEASTEANTEARIGANTEASTTQLGVSMQSTKNPVPVLAMVNKNNPTSSEAWAEMIGSQTQHYKKILTHHIHCPKHTAPQNITATATV
ncbi:orotidine 5'-phosphate decarboxylase [Spirochaetota bacterium]|nr:orotidine 5'-phosphate decarboxylase [Spirochaetota bacterium]